MRLSGSEGVHPGLGSAGGLGRERHHTPQLGEDKTDTGGPEHRPSGANRGCSPGLAARRSGRTGGEGLMLAALQVREPPVGARGGNQRSRHPLGGRDSCCWALLASPPSPRFTTHFFFLLENLPEDSLHSDFSWVCVGSISSPFPFDLSAFSPSTCQHSRVCKRSFW